MKKFLLVPFFIFVLLALGLAWFYINIQPPSTKQTFQNFLIEKGSSAAQIGDKLESAGLIKNAYAFRIYVHFTGLGSRIPTGEFRLSPSYSVFQTVDQLLRGPIEIWVTIPEGLRREEIAARFTSALEQNQTFTNEFLASSKGDEGMLFPDTYLFPKDASASAIVAKMNKTFSIKTANLTPASSLTFNQSLTLASILERETKTDAERPVVAGILINRLNAGMPLQVDATVQYAVGTVKDWWPILTLEDLKINSRFNTYKFAGLPPAPIASPGLSSLTAAFNPAKTDYFYYIHDPSGTIHYAKTLAEHNTNIRMYLTKP